MMPESQNLLPDSPEERMDSESKIFGTKSEELIPLLDKQGNMDVDEKVEKESKKIVAKKVDEILPGTLHAEDVRGKLIKFLKAHGFKKVDSNGHEKYRNDKNVTVEVPHQHGYFALLDKIVKEAGYTKKDYINRKNRGKKGNRKNKENRYS